MDSSGNRKSKEYQIKKVLLALSHAVIISVWCFISCLILSFAIFWQKYDQFYWVLKYLIWIFVFI